MSQNGILRGVAQSTVTGSTATIDVGGKSVTAQVARGLTLASGDPVMILRESSKWWVISRLYASAPTPPTNDVAPDPQPTSRSGSLVCSPIETRTRLATVGVWRTDGTSTYQGSRGTFGLHLGAAFYGEKPRSLEGATVDSATIQVQRLAGGNAGAETVTLRLVTEPTRPSGTPTLTSSTTGPSLDIGETDSAFTIPTAWAQEIVDGTSGGLAIYDADGDPYVRLAGISDWSPAWAMTINWTRS